MWSGNRAGILKVRWILVGGSGIFMRGGGYQQKSHLTPPDVWLALGYFISKIYQI